MAEGQEPWPQRVAALPVRDNVSALDGMRHKLYRRFSEGTFDWWSDATPDQVNGPVPFSAYALSSTHFAVRFEKERDGRAECVLTLYDYDAAAVLIVTCSERQTADAPAIAFGINKGSLNAPLTYDTLVAHPGFDPPPGARLVIKDQEVERHWTFGKAGAVSEHAANSAGKRGARKLTTRCFRLSRSIVAMTWHAAQGKGSGIGLISGATRNSLWLSAEFPSPLAWRETRVDIFVSENFM